ncbi:MAG: hypothetical protein IT370_36140 [Deltaproteobacteria bacterium]|nr:hypothetical protein [Deltaproteobacteria bacterium]
MATSATRPLAARTLLLLPAYSALFGGAYFAEWLRVHGYPPLLSTGVQFVALGVLAWVAGMFLRRALRRAHHQALATHRELPPQLAPTACDWLISAACGLLVVTVPAGATSVTLARLPISVVVTAAIAGQCWRRVLAARLPSWWQAVATACSLAALGLLARSPDVGGWRMAVVLLGGALVGRMGSIIWRAAVSHPHHQVMSIAWLVGGAALLLVGRHQGELWAWGPRRATLALFAPLVVLTLLIGLGWLNRRPHLAIVCRASAGMLALVLLGGRFWLGDRLQQVTWLAIGLTMVAALVDPGDLRDDGRAVTRATDRM